MLSIFTPGRIARTSARHPWLTLGFWAVLIAAALLSASSIKFDERASINGSDSERAHQLIVQMRGSEPVTETVVVQSLGQKVDDPAYHAFVAELAGNIRRLDGVVESAVTYYDTNDPTLVSKDRSKTIIPVVIKGDVTDAADTVVPLLKVLDDASAHGNGFVAMTAGDGSINRDLQTTSEKDLKSAEYIGLPAALIVLIFVFGAGVAAGVPVVLGLLGILLSVGITALIGRFIGVGSIVINMITMIGLAVGIDYTLFIVERFREERARGVEKVEAIVAAGDTASRAVLFSGITVIIALCGLLIVPSSIYHGLAIGAITVVMAAVAIALSLLPAVLSLLDNKLNWLHLPGRGRNRVHDNEDGFWGRSTALVMRHPVISIVASVGFLLAMAAPVVEMKLGNPGLSNMPADLKSIQAFTVLDRDFSAGEIAPAQVVIQGDVNSPAVQQGVQALRARVAGDPAFGKTGDLDVSSDGKIGLLNVLVNGDPSDKPAQATVERLRHTYIPEAFNGTGARVVVGGASAGTTDYINTMKEFIPIVIAFVLSLSFILLMLVFRSLVIPVKAMIMNLLSVGAAYGLIVAVFQRGIGIDLLGFQRSDEVTAWLPIFLFTVLFGLSMDYHVFLLSRIQERFVQTGDNTGAVAHGLRSTAHIITGAAAIMVVVFSSFALGDMVELQQMGFGLAVAVFIDATIVRSVLVPASMEMLGAWNWYLPSWLRWLPTISVEGAARASAPRVSPHMTPALAPCEAVAAGGD